MGDLRCMLTRILLIEDTEDDAELVRMELERRGFRVLVAQDLNRGLRFLRAGRADVVLLDLALPDVVSEFDGLQRIVEGFPTIPVIVYTGEAAEEDVRDEALRHGAAACLFKDEARGERLAEELRSVVA